MVTPVMHLWDTMEWRRLDSTAKRILLAWRMNAGDGVAEFCLRYRAPKQSVMDVMNTEGFEELQGLLDENTRLLRENNRLRQALRYDQ